MVDLRPDEVEAMGDVGGQVVRKHFRLDAGKLKRAQKALGAATETETVEKALELVISEEERDRVTWEATMSFLKSGVEVRDVFGALGEY